MRYYKIIKDNTIIGVATSNNFMAYSQYSDSYSRADEDNGEYVYCNGKFYRDSWMQPPQQLLRYEQAIIIPILDSEYEAFISAIISNQTINIIEEEDKDEVIEEITLIDPIEQESLDFIRSSKILEMSHACRQIIEAGFDLELRGETYHFSLDTQDQLNLISLSEMAKTQQLIPYHADGEACVFYTPAEIEQIVAAATSHKMYHTTYYNALKTYINALDTIEAISAITYGTPIPDEYKSEVLRVIEQ